MRDGEDLLKLAGSFTGRSGLFFASRGDRVFHIPGNGIETHDPRPNQKNCERFRSDQVTNATELLFGLRPPGVVARTLLRNNGGGHFKLKTQIPNINMVRSAWRRIKKDIKDAIIRDLKPIKDVKGGGRVAGESKTTRGEGTRRATGDH
jgi:hypothetical protein